MSTQPLRPASAPGDSPAGALPLTVLLVDDEELIREFAEESLRLHGFEVVAAGSGDEAMAAAEARRVDVVLLDVNMPALNGWETLERLRKRFPALPVVMASGYAEPHEAAERGAVALLTKPYSVRALVEAVRGALAPAP